MKRRADYSQNFLRSPKLVESLVARSTLSKDDVVYDIGAGSGVITSVLAPRVKQVIAIEFDPRVAKTLSHNMSNFSNVTVKIGDIMQMNLPTTPYKIFANIPFHLSSPIVQRFINSPTAPEAAYLIVQRQFGRKLIATDTTHFTGQLGMLIGAEYSVKIIKSLRKTDFWPHPAVDTVMVELIKRKQPLVAKNRLSAYSQFTINCFSDPKKLAVMPLTVIGAEPGLSPSRLSLDRWVNLFNAQTVY
jgi:16S rRNA A1518/A1519 N6-dimethyltransferase RsmA/KsgA/DIM1 with predicted DNA glycosylase/AP lyase activity